MIFVRWFLGIFIVVPLLLLSWPFLFIGRALREGGEWVARWWERIEMDGEPCYMCHWMKRCRGKLCNCTCHGARQA